MNGGMHARVDLETILYEINLYHAEKQIIKVDDKYSLQKTRYG